MFRQYTYRWCGLFLLLILPLQLRAQEADTGAEPAEDSVELIRSMPIISLSYGVMNFRGDVRNDRLSPAVGFPGYSLSISTEINRWPFLSAYFYYTRGNLGGVSVDLNDPERSANFYTSLDQIGASLEYTFDHIIPVQSPVRPYVRMGLGIISFSPKGDLVDAAGDAYYYWNDGTLHSAPEATDPAAARLYRDHVYETDLRLHEEINYGLGDYGQRSIALPLAIGVHFKVYERLSLSMGFSYNFTFTDMIDNVAAEGTYITGNKRKDAYVFSMVSLHFDLFSPPEKVAAREWFEDFDMLLTEDEDADFVVDLEDHCPGTPPAVSVDTLGCPFDEDGDGVPDYIDLEPATAPDAWVDELGQTVIEEQWLAAISTREKAMPRSDAEAYHSIVRHEYQYAGSVDIPEKFERFDEDEDGYISFDELLQAIDRYFDSAEDMHVGELRELNDFFFAQ